MVSTRFVRTEAPFGVALDSQGFILVNSVVVRFWRDEGYNRDLKHVLRQCDHFFFLLEVCSTDPNTADVSCVVLAPHSKGMTRERQTQMMRACAVAHPFSFHAFVYRVLFVPTLRRALCDRFRR